jgi:hypothetical protein
MKNWSRKENQVFKIDSSSSQRELSAQEMIDILRQTGYEVRKIDRGAVVDMPLKHYR